MIHQDHVRDALNRLVAVAPKPSSPDDTLAEWVRALSRFVPPLEPVELSNAVDHFIATTESFWGQFPAPAQIVVIIKARRGSPAWKEREPEAEKAPPGTAREAWLKAGVDLDELERLHRMRSSSQSATRAEPPTEGES